MDINTCTITYPSSVSYDVGNSDIRVPVTVSDNGTPLVEDTHYTLTFFDNNKAGTAHIRVDGLGDYAGTYVVKDFTITPIPIDSDKINLVIIDPDSTRYTGSQICPAYKIMGRDNEGDMHELVSGTDYMFESWGQNIYPPEGQLSIRGINDFDGNVTFTFDIFNIDIADCTFTCGAATFGFYDPNNFKVSYQGTDLIEGADYINFGTRRSDTRIDGKYCTIFTGEGNENNYFEGNFEVSFPTRVPITLVDAEYNHHWKHTGTNIEPPLTSVTYHPSAGVTETLVEGTDYTKSYADNVDVGIGKIILTGIGEYTGSVELTFNIDVKYIEECTITYPSNVGYTGSVLEPEVVITDGAYTLVRDTDYTMYYTNNTDAGTGYIHITGINEYGSFVRCEFTIDPMDLRGFEFIYPESATYTGNPITPAVAVKRGTTPLVQDQDFTVDYQNNTSLGLADIIVEGIGNYIGTKYLNFEIVQRSISDCTFIYNDTYTYSGSPYTPSIIVKYGDDVLVENEHYTLLYSDNIEPGQGKIKITACETLGNVYSGETNKFFTILGRDISTSCTFSEVEDVIYNDQDHTPAVEIKYGAEVLVEGTDYVIAYTNNHNPGTATITINGINHYRETKTINFTIKKRTILDNTQCTYQASVVFDGVGCHPEITVTDEYASDDIRTLEEGEDYQVTYVDNEGIGTAAFTIIGIGNYEGTQEFNYEITRASIENCDLSCGEPYESGVYNENNFKVSLYNGFVLVEGRDYTLQKERDEDSDREFKLTIFKVTGIGNFENYQDATFPTGLQPERLYFDEMDAHYDYDRWVYTGIEIEPDIIFTYEDPETGAIVTVTPPGNFTVEYEDNINATNQAIIRVRAIEGNELNLYGEAVYEFIINAAPINTTTASCGTPDQRGHYDMSKFKLEYQGMTLTEDDYEKELIVTEDDYFIKNHYRVTGLGNYSGVWDAPEYPVDDVVINIKTDCDIIYDSDEQMFTGFKICPAVTVKYHDRVLIEGIEYSIVYGTEDAAIDNIKVGVGTIHLYGQTEWSDPPEFPITTSDVHIEFSIVPRDVATLTAECLPLPGRTDIYDISSVSFHLGDFTLVTGRDYDDITPEDNTEVRDPYYYKFVRIMGKGNFTSIHDFYFPVDDLETDIASCTITYDGTFTYNGEEQKPPVSIVNGSYVLVENTDYELNYSDNIDAGNGIIHLIGIGENYRGTKDCLFDILPLDIGDPTVIYSCGEPDDDGCYDKNNFKIEFNENELHNHTDYIIVREENVSLEGDSDYIYWQVTVRGINNFTGTAIRQFRSSLVDHSVDINNCSITLDEDEFPYTGEVHEPVVHVMYGDQDLIENIHYNIFYKNNVNAGQASIIINGLGDYYNTTTVYFIINKTNYDACTATCGPYDSYGCYNPNNFEVSFNGKKLEYSRDYDTMVVTFPMEHENRIYTRFTIFAPEGADGNFEGSATFMWPTSLINYDENDINRYKNTFFQAKTRVTYDFGNPVYCTLTNSTLIEGVDYAIEWINNINVTTPDNLAIARVVGINGYTGSIEFPFEIIAKMINTPLTRVECGEPDEEGFYDLANLDLIIANDGEDVHLVKELEWVIGKVETVAKDEKILSIVTINGIGNFRNSVTASFFTGKVFPDINDHYFQINDMEYTGKFLTPIIHSDLTLGEQYEISRLEDNVNVGLAKCIIVGINNYVGTKTLYFNIRPKDIVDAEIHVPPIVDEVYDKDAVYVTCDNIRLVPAVDYDIFFEDKTIVRMKISIITVQGKNNYTGVCTRIVHLNNVYLDINDTDIKVVFAKEYRYNYTPYEPSVISEQVEEGKDYTVTYSNNIYPGTAEIVIAGIGFYEGSYKIEHFTILGKLIDDAIISCGEPDADGLYDIYNLKLTLEDGTILRKNSNYVVKMTSEDDYSQGYRITTVEITGVIYYTGTVTVSYPTAIIKEQEPEAENPEEIEGIRRGVPIYIEDAPIFARFCSLRYDDIKTGTYYIFDDKIRAGKVRIVSEPEALEYPGMVTGWVPIQYVIKRSQPLFKLKDKVIVSGKLYQYANGKGSYIIKNNEPMYIVEILNEDEFEYCYGVSPAPHLKNQGWVSKKNVSAAIN